jgi:hypothetical protein
MVDEKKTIKEHVAAVTCTQNMKTKGKNSCQFNVNMMNRE